MENFKEAFVVMLPTKKEPVKGQLILRHIWKNDPELETNKLYQYNETHFYSSIAPNDTKVYSTLNGGGFEDIYTSFVAQHLYVISDDEITDWYYIPDQMLGFEHISNEKYPKEVLESIGAKKIIATTDTSLNYIKHDDTVPYPKGEQIRLPQLAQEFKERFIGSYDRGDVISKVLVEYIDVIPQSNGLRSDGKIMDEIGLDPTMNTLSVPRLNYKDNTIVIK